MKPRFFLLIIAPLMFTYSHLSADIQHVAARVNEDIITDYEVEKIIKPIVAQLRQLYTGQELEDNLRDQRAYILNRLIENRLLIQAAAGNSIDVADEEIEKMLEMEVKRLNCKDVDDYAKGIEKAGWSLSQEKGLIKEQIMIQKLLYLKFAKSISVTPKEIRSYYEKNQSAFMIDERVRLRMILIETEKFKDKEEARKEAEASLKKIKDGEADFAVEAKRISTGPYTEKGGDWGWLKRGTLVSELEAAAFSLPVGQVSNIIETKLGYHIIKVEAKESGRLIPFEEAQHKISDIIQDMLLNIKKDELTLELWQSAYIADGGDSPIGVPESIAMELELLIGHYMYIKEDIEEARLHISKARDECHIKPLCDEAARLLKEIDGNLKKPVLKGE